MRMLIGKLWSAVGLSMLTVALSLGLFGQREAFGWAKTCKYCTGCSSAAPTSGPGKNCTKGCNGSTCSQSCRCGPNALKTACQCT
jgi:hypothetical protein